MRDAINKSKSGVTASIMRVGDNDYQLALSSTTPGEKTPLRYRSITTTSSAPSSTTILKNRRKMAAPR
ncbi:flagellin hook IN motif-containing protein [Serratia marcescens]|uniref:flagellin hook IN motif-containing protein n=1 Tax=Serratia marcescens TaxID=615 RepID=UPI0038BBEBD6